MAEHNSQKIGLYYSDLTDEFFNDVIDKIKPRAKLTKWIETNLDPDSLDGVQTSISKSENEAIVGFKAFRIYFECVSSEGTKMEETKNVVLKVRKDSSALHKDIVTFYSGFSEALGEETRRISGPVWFKEITLRDIYCLAEKRPAWQAILPKIYKLICDKERQTYAYVVDNYTSPENGYTHVNVTDTPEVWTHDDVLEMFKQLANFHAQYFGRLEKIPSNVASVVDPPLTVEMGNELKMLFQLHHDVNTKKCSHYFNPEILTIFDNALKNFHTICAILEKGPHTLIHNDCTIRNMCKRKNPAASESCICIYDWELATMFPPQHDVIDFLMLWLPSDVTIDTWYEYLDTYRKYLIGAMEAEDEAMTQEVKDALEKDAFMQMSDMCFLEYFLCRHHMYLTASNAMKFPFIERMIAIRDTVLIHLKGRYDFL